jgi:hypothetical protein
MPKKNVLGLGDWSKSRGYLTISHALLTGKSIIHFSSGKREVHLAASRSQKLCIVYRICSNGVGEGGGGGMEYGVWSAS